MEMFPLDEVEARVLACLVEKQVTTPESYPMTLNGLTAACNQKSNRDPVLELAEADVVRAEAERIERLEARVAALEAELEAFRKQFE